MRPIHFHHSATAKTTKPPPSHAFKLSGKHSCGVFTNREDGLDRMSYDTIVMSSSLQATM